MKCENPKCKQKATTSWALVPLCYKHYNAIKDETIRYYGNVKPSEKIPYDERLHYFEIAHKIPWSQVSKGVY